MTNPKRYNFCTNESPHLRERADGTWVRHDDVQADLTQLRGNLSLAEEGLANYALEVASLQVQRDHWLEIAREKDSLIDTQDAAQTSLHAENVRLRVENDRLRKGIEECIGTSSWEAIRGDLRLVLRGGSSEPRACALDSRLDPPVGVDVYGLCEWWRIKALELRAVLDATPKQTAPSPTGADRWHLDPPV